MLSFGQTIIVDDGSKELRDRARRIREAVPAPIVAQLLGFGPGPKIECPWHGEHEASLQIYNDGYFCYGGCPQGDRAHSVIDLVMEVHQMDLPEAIELLERQFGLADLPPGATVQAPIIPDKARWLACERAIIQLVRPYLLDVPDGIYSRIRDEVWRAYDVWDHYAQAARAAGEAPEAVLEAVARPIRAHLKKKLLGAAKEVAGDRTPHE
jgi:hypothetical protein